MEGEKQLLNIYEASEFLGMTVSYLRMLRFKRQIGVVRIGRRVLFRRSDLEALIEAGYEPPQNG